MADSVGVRIPVRIPPTMIIGANMGRSAPLKVLINDLSEKAVLTDWSSFRNVTMKKQTIMKDTPKSIPGIIPPRKSLPTDIPVMLPNTIIGMLGGMMMPRVPDEAIIAAEKSLLYPHFSMLGTMMLLKAEVSAGAEPEMPPNNMPVRTLT